MVVDVVGDRPGGSPHTVNEGAGVAGEGEPLEDHDRSRSDFGEEVVRRCAPVDQDGGVVAEQFDEVARPVAGGVPRGEGRAVLELVNLADGRAANALCAKVRESRRKIPGISEPVDLTPVAA